MPELQRVFGKPGRGLWEEGDILVQPDLAATLEQIADAGPQPFYEGAIAQRIVDEVNIGGGLITRQDLMTYEARIREPIHGVYRGFDIYAPPPPSSGGVTLIEILNILEPFELREMGRWSPSAMHFMAEAMRRAYCDRAKYLGDPDFVSIPLHLTSKQYARQVGRQINVARATPSHLICRDLKLYDEKLQLYDESTSTAHFCVIDQQGGAVSNTYTLEQKYGSRVVVRGAGFLLNNEMADFNWRPGHTDRAGGIGTAANQIAPGKRMLSSQTPVLVSRNGELLLLTGSPGGREIVNTVACVLLNILEFEMDLRAAIDAPRIHHQWFPDRLQFEGYGLDRYGASVRGLQIMGHTLRPPMDTQGAAHSILVRKERFYGAADRRQSGSAVGY
jgi:gamma-glutamyltranspeptidase/glutathione hydrolase